MIRNKEFKTLFLIIAIITGTYLNGCAQKGNREALAIGFYNCENFFDIADDPATQDEEFTPGGKYHYTQKIYEQKLHNIATVIQAMGGAEGPALLGMVEVENHTVLTDLANQPELARRHYKYEIFQGPDPRGINVALLYNPASFRVLTSEPLHVDLSATTGKAITRDVLYVRGILAGDTVYVLVNHWPSRRGGEEESGPKRAIAALVNKEAAARVLKNNPAAKVIIMGDLNDNPTDEHITGVLGAKAEPKEVALSGFYNPWINIFTSGGGTEVYKHQWNLFDQIIISGGWLQNRNHKLSFSKAEIYKPDFIIDHYKGHEGEPHRSFVGTHWINGYSDHFPVLIYVTK